MLIVMAGLPGAGKSTIAQVIGSRLSVPVVSVDPIEVAILRAGIDKKEPTGLAAYLVAETHAETILVSGRGVIIDAVNAVDPAREQWVNLAKRQSASLKFIEVVCSDPAVHRDRIEAREREVPKLDMSWNVVEQSLDEYSDWSGPSAAVGRITLDSVESLGLNIDRAMDFLEP